MAVERYRIKDPTIAMFQDGDLNFGRTISIGTIIELRGGPLDGNNLVEVVYDGKPCKMFSRDLRQRADRLADLAESPTVAGAGPSNGWGSGSDG